MERWMNEVVEGWKEMEGHDKVVWVVGKVCENGGVRRAIESMYMEKTVHLNQQMKVGSI